jgi:hypothetical protein
VKWTALPRPEGNDPQKYRDWVRLNSLASLFFFLSYTLKRSRLAKLHWYMCSVLETEDLHLVFEIPMSHFKTVCGVEGLSMWWALSFTDRDEMLMRQHGYGDEWIRYMRSIHNQNSRTLITHETDARVIEMGKVFDEHYSHNDIFRFAFSDLIPDGSQTWNNHSKFQRRDRSQRGDASTATFVMRSVGTALQGIHATGIINDDSVGRKAQSNLLEGDGTIMEGTYRWWKQTTTRFDPESFTKTGIGRQLVIGNRWAHRDLNYWIRENHPEFKFETHDAEGGCCEQHPVHGIPIFPEEWTMERLLDQKRTLADKGKNYDYITFYRNKTTLPEDALFKSDWIRKYECCALRPDLADNDYRNGLALRHLVKDGEVIPDLNAGVLHKRMIAVLADPKRRRPNHVVLVAGYEPERDWIYLLKLEVGKPMFGELLDKIYKLAAQQGLSEFYLDKKAADALKWYLEERNRRDKKNALRVYELTCDDSEIAQSQRIESLQSLFKGKQFLVHPSFKEFFAEYDAYPGGPVEVLNAVGMIPSTLEGIRRKDLSEWILAQQSAFASRNTGAGGY